VSRNLTVAAAVAAVLLVLAGPASAGTPAWVQAPPIPIAKSALTQVLSDVTVIAPDDVWVVGGWSGDDAHTLAVHWNGTAWITASTPDAVDEGGEYRLNAVDAVAPDDVWSVGGILSGSTAKTKPLFIHYDGVVWTEQPGTVAIDGELSDLDLLATGEGWAVGTVNSTPLIVRRTAGQWYPVDAPPIPGPASLVSVAVTSPTDAWAVGTRVRDGHTAALVLHWDGVTWTDVAVPDAGPADEVVMAVGASTGSDVWIVGALCTPICQSRVLHMKDGSWGTEAASPGATLTSVIAFAPDNVWIFGQATLSALIRDHIEHWDGSQFTVDISVPPVASQGHGAASALSLAAAAADSDTGTMWAVGWIESGSLRTGHALYHP